MADDLIQHAKSGEIGRDRVRGTNPKLVIVDDGHGIPVTITVSGQTFHRMVQIAKRRDQHPIDMVQQLVIHAIDDDMVEAIIDDGRGS